jgi:very-short-patch-repair endonuclease
MGAMRPQGRTVEQEVARIAGRAHGVVTREQLVSAGITADEIKQRVQSGSLIRVHRGVYRVGHTAPSLEARYLAAVLACGKGAAISGRAAGHLLGLLKGAAPPPEVTAPTERRVAGVKTRRSKKIEAARHNGIPVTTVPRTLLDLAAVLDDNELARAVHEAEVRHRNIPALVDAVLARQPNAPGAAKARRILRGDTRVTLSKLESRFLKLLQEARLPLPRTNQLAGTKRVDCRWPEHRLTVELDSYRYHQSRHAWEQDRRREREAHARGDELRRYTYRDVFEAPAAMLAELSRVLRR